MADTNSGKQRLALHWQILAAMIIGTIIGVIVNPGEIAVPAGVTAKVVFDDSGVKLIETSDSGDVVHSESFASKDAFADSFPKLAEQWTVEAEQAVEVTDTRARLVYSMGTIDGSWQRSHNGVPAVTTFSAASVEKLPAFWMSLAKDNPPGFAATVTTVAKALGDLFLRLLKMVTVPLILTSLITGVTGLGSQGNFGRMFSKTIGYYIMTSILAIMTGLVLVNIVKPGVGAVLPGGGKALESADQGLLEIIYQQILRLIPTNPFAAIADGEFLSIISFAIMLGLFINFVGGEHGKRLSEFFESAFAVMMKMTGWVISLAPVGVAAFMIYATASQGLAIFGTLAW